MWGRDSQRRKVYTAQMPGGGWDKQHRVDTFAEIKVYTQQILATEFVKQMNGGFTPDVNVTENVKLKVSAVAYGTFQISFGPGAFYKSVALHEIAHIVNPGEKHGRLWARAYLQLTRKFLGDAAWKLLKEAFKARGVKYSAGRKLSPERQAALKQRGKELAAQKYGRSLTQGEV